MSTQIASLFAEISADTKKFDRGMDGVKKDLQGGEKSVKTWGKNWTTTLGIAMGTAAALGVTVKKAFDFAESGAQLDRSEQKFYRLAAAIGTTGSALEKDLMRATGGLYSRMDTLTNAADFMALGLAKDHDEAVRLTSVASALGMNMNQLVLTLTNMTTMRFDALGVQVDGFDEKMKALEDQGYSTADAFKEAFLVQAEEQVKKSGDIIEDQIAVYMEFEATLKNFSDAAKQTAASALEPLIKGLTETFQKELLLQEAIANGTAVRRGGNQVYFEAYDVTMSLAAASKWLAEVEELAADETARSAEEAYIATRAYEDYEGVVWSSEGAVSALADETFKLADQTAKAANKTQELADALGSLPGSGVFEGILEDIQKIALGGDVLIGMEDLIRQVYSTGRDELASELAMLSAAFDVVASYNLGDMNYADAKKALMELGFSAEEAEAYLASINNLLKAIDGAVAQATIIINTVDVGNTGANKTVTSGAGYDPAGFTARASGGPINMNDVFLVGEQGPELLIGGQVIPADKTRKLLGLGFEPLYNNRLAAGGFTSPFPDYPRKPPPALPPGITQLSGATDPNIGLGSGSVSDGGAAPGSYPGLPPGLASSMIGSGNLSAAVTQAISQQIGNMSAGMNSRLDRMIAVLTDQPSNDGMRALMKDSFAQRGQ